MAHSPRNRVGGIPIYPDMQGKVALVTGGSSGIGLATAGAFARQGVKVVIASRREATAKTALKQLSTLGDVQWLSVDAADGKSVARLMDGIMNTHGHLDYAFNNGGSGGRLAPVAKMREEAWRKTIDGYLTSVFLCMNAENSGNEGAEHIRDSQQRFGRWNARLSLCRRRGLLGSKAWGDRSHS